MPRDRREFVKVVGLATVAMGVPVSATITPQDVSQPARLRALVFDAYGTLFDVFSVTALCERLFPGQGAALAQLWRAKQLQYSLLRSMMGRYLDFWRLTEDGLVYACNFLKLDLTDQRRAQLMDAYLTLEAFSDVRPSLDALKQRGLRLAILSNGEPRMLRAASKHAGIESLLDDIMSVDALKTFKPSPAVYGLASQRLKLATGGIGFISSNSWDINGAASAGLTTFWIRRSQGEPPEELGYAATHVVTSLSELVRLVVP